MPATLVFVSIGQKSLDFQVLPQNVWVAEAAEAAMESASPRQIG
jgi:hypothetical protein